MWLPQPRPTTAALRLTELSRQSVVFLVSFYRYIWADTTRHAATPASPDPVAVIQKLDAIIK